MKEKELRQYAQCGLCQRKIGECGLPIFHRVTVESYGLDFAAIQRLQGLTMLLAGNAMLASAMGQDEDIAKQIGDTTTITVCATCYAEKTYPIALLDELGSRKGTP